MKEDEKIIFKIGTRGSLLALTQCGQVKDLLEKRTGCECVLVPIKTQGDLQTTQPLWQMTGQNFFTRELDHALLAHEVDFVVHSYKDLGSLRPEGLVLGAVTERQFAYDILLVKNSEKQRLLKADKITVGTSSPRRMENLSCRLDSFLPRENDIAAEIVPVMLRGNVNTRIEKLHQGEFDTLVLAMAGLERLAQTPSSRQVLAQLLEGLDFMILPQSVFPSAASQGALAIECAASHPLFEEISALLQSVHHEGTAKEVAMERQIFNQYGGGCHLAVGINCRLLESDGKGGGLAIFEHGKTYEGGRVDKNQILFSQEKRSGEELKFLRDEVFIGTRDDKGIEKKSLPVDWNALEQRGLRQQIVATCDYVTDGIPVNMGMELWSAGVKTWKTLASKGHWVHGCMDSMGEKSLVELQQSELMKIFWKGVGVEWIYLSYDQAETILTPARVVTAYGRRVQEDCFETLKGKMQTVKACYWMSDFQYETYVQKFPDLAVSGDVQHFCGPGKTYRKLKNKIPDTRLHPVLSVADFLETYTLS